MRPNLLRAKYTMAARRSILATLTVLCLIYIVAWWYMSQYGPGGRHVYGITSLSWQNSTAPGVGTLTVALDRTRVRVLVPLVRAVGAAGPSGLRSTFRCGPAAA